MKNRILLLLSIVGLMSCTRESVYDNTEMTIQEAISIYVSDAYDNGVDYDFSKIEVQFVPMSDGFHGLAFGTSIQINSNYWKGSKVNLNTVYHEFGHVLGLGHDVTPIMSSLSAPSGVMKNKKEYWKLIKESLNEK